MRSKLLFTLLALLVITSMIASCAPAAATEEEKPAVAVEQPSGEWSLAKAAEPWKGETLRLIGEALERHRWNKARVARELGLSYPTLLARIRSLKLERRRPA